MPDVRDVKEYVMPLYGDFVRNTLAENEIFIRKMLKDYLRFSAPAVTGYRYFLTNLAKDPRLDKYIAAGVASAWAEIHRLGWVQKYSSAENTNLNIYRHDLTALDNAFRKLYACIKHKDNKLFVENFAYAIQYLFFYVEYVLMGHTLVSGLKSQSARSIYDADLKRVGDDIQITLRLLRMELGRLGDFAHRMKNIRHEAGNRRVEFTAERNAWLDAFIGRIHKI